MNWFEFTLQVAKVVAQISKARPPTSKPHNLAQSRYFSKFQKPSRLLGIQFIVDYFRIFSFSRFAKNLEAIVSTSNFGTSIPSDFSCKVELGPNRFVAQVFVPELGLDAKTTTRRHRIPYHELSREDLSDAADLVVSRNGIIVSKLL